MFVSLINSGASSVIVSGTGSGTIDRQSVAVIENGDQLLYLISSSSFLLFFPRSTVGVNGFGNVCMYVCLC